jgi:hypothetical protein
MSTRCTINFGEGRSATAKVYRHCDGYPDGPHGVLADLDRFFSEVEEQCEGKGYSGTRFGDAAYLAAKYVVWQANENRNGRATLDFLSVGILNRDPGDIEFTYFVNCGKRDNRGRPEVRHRPASE